MLLAITSSALINLLIWLVILALIYFVVDWALKQFGLPEPFNKIIRVIVVIIIAVLAIKALLAFA